MSLYVVILIVCQHHFQSRENEPCHVLCSSQCDHICKFYYHSCLDLVGLPPPVLNIAICKARGVSKCIQPDLIIKVTKSGHTGSNCPYFKVGVARTVPNSHVIVFCSMPLRFSKSGVLCTVNEAAP